MKITTEKEYNSALDEINGIMKKGESNATEKEIIQLQKLTENVELFETEFFSFPIPKTIIEMVELRMFERKMTQTDLAQKTKIPLPKINQILKGRRNPDIDFLKGIYRILNIPADFIFSRL